MVRGDVVIDSDSCLGCGYCVEFCPKESLKISTDSYTSQGILVVEFSDPEPCNACGLCVWMCPHFAIEVYKVREEGGD